MFILKVSAILFAFCFLNEWFSWAHAVYGTLTRDMDDMMTNDETTFFSASLSICFSSTTDLGLHMLQKMREIKKIRFCREQIKKSADNKNVGK